jgi:hypothetical protein
MSVNIFPGAVPSLPLSGNFPGITFYAQEPSGIQFDMREINGLLWIASNAYFDLATQAWTQVNSATGSYAFVADGTAGTFSIYFAAAGSPAPIVWGTPGARLAYT